MKIKMNVWIGLCFLFITSMSSTLMAQKDKDAKKIMSELTTEQQQLIKAQQMLIDENRAVFKNNLTERQHSILNDRKLSKERRTQLLRESLSSRQRDLLRTNRNSMIRNRDHFRKSLTKGQKQRLRRVLHDRKFDDRKRLARRLRRLIRDNMD